MNATRPLKNHDKQNYQTDGNPKLRQVEALQRKPPAIQGFVASGRTGFFGEQLDASFSQFKPDTYRARLPEWIRRNAGAGFVGQISDDDARYIERVAWEV